MSRFKIIATSITDLKIIKRLPIGDNRGCFERIFCENDLKELLAGRRIVQINHSFTHKKGVVRGMHFQYPPHAELKIVNCLRGEIFDVAVDLRRGSPTFLKWHGEHLSADNNQALFIPEGFAHGFQTYSEDCELIYLHSAPYCQASEGGISIHDPRIRFTWPLPIAEFSLRDAGFPMLSEDFEGIQL
jgi:dTDP-4-dehydrorhamnose 3,5-epimerase